MIKQVTVKSDVILFNKHHDNGYGNKKGIMIIEEDNGKKSYLDLLSSNDITNAVNDYINIVDTKKTKEKVLWRNILHDTERLEKLSKGGK